jgi:hypothetical protein
MRERLDARAHQLRMDEAKEARIMQLNDNIEGLTARMAELRDELYELENGGTRIQNERLQDTDELYDIVAEKRERLEYLMNLDDDDIENFDEFELDLDNAIDDLDQFERFFEVEQRIAEIEAEMPRLQTAIDAAVEIANSQLAQLSTARAERDMAAIEQEIIRQQREMDSRMRDREREAEEQYARRLEEKSEEELEAAAERSAMRGFAMMDTHRGDISSLTATRANMQASATRLRGEPRMELHRQRIANEAISANAREFNSKEISRREAHRERLMRAGYSGSDLESQMDVVASSPMRPNSFFSESPLSIDSFKGQHLVSLGAGIARTTANIDRAVSAMYRDSKSMQEEQLRIYREKANAHSEEDDDYENPRNVERNAQAAQYEAIDLRL